MTYNSGANVNVSYYCDLSDNNRVVLNPRRLDDSKNSQKTYQSQRSFSQGVHTPGFCSVPFSDVITKPDGNPPSYSEIYQDLNSSRTGRLQNSNRISGVHNFYKKKETETVTLSSAASCQNATC